MYELELRKTWYFDKKKTKKNGHSKIGQMQGCICLALPFFPFVYSVTYRTMGITEECAGLQKIINKKKQKPRHQQKIITTVRHVTKKSLVLTA